MATQAVAQTPQFQIDISHAQEVLDLFTKVTIGPFKNCLYYFAPFIGAGTEGSTEMRRNDAAQEAMMPARIKEAVFQEIDALARCAPLQRRFAIHTALNQIFMNFGGRFSLTQPIILIPHQFLFRQGNTPFAAETTQQPADLSWNFTADETRFLIARQIAQMKRNEGIWRFAVKIALFTVLFFLYATPLPFLLGLTMGTIALGSYLLYERSFEKLSDKDGVKLLSRRFNDSQRAREAALGAIEKLRLQNCLRRERSRLCRIYVTARGANLIDLAHSSPDSRRENLQALA